MTLWGVTRLLIVLLALVAGLLLATGSLKTRNVAGQFVFVAGWFLALFSSLVVVQNY